ncbi:MAG: ShlB/FhaC/HecB family hemolysin secretion/activation protein [Symploca sp. SIO2B6]|nr:ShlB/FhaC/HecB family hemolysin secretion/activation protein [Symploca sp. SIO2B6]
MLLIPSYVDRCRVNSIETHLIAGLGTLTVLGIWAVPSFAQAQAPASPNGTIDIPIDLPSELPDSLPDTLDQTIPDRPSDPEPALPDPLPESLPLPELTIPAPDQPPTPSPIPEASFFMNTITVVGSTVLDDDIAALVTEYEQRQVTFDELLTLRSRLTQLYIDNGYITSGAFLPSNQVLTDGTVTIQVVEGEVERIVVNGTRHLRQSYVRVPRARRSRT